MADNTIQFGITVDASTVSSGLADVRSAFQSTTSSVAGQWTETSSTVALSLKKIADEAEATSGRTKEQIEKAAGAVDLLGDMIGVKVPDQLRKMLASSSLVGPALESAFSGIAIVAMVELLVKVGEKIADLASGWQHLNDAELQSINTLAAGMKKQQADQEKLLEIARAKELVGKTAVQSAQLQAQWAREDQQFTGQALTSVREQYDAAQKIIALHEKDLRTQTQIASIADRLAIRTKETKEFNEELAGARTTVAQFEAIWGEGLRDLEQKAAVSAAKRGEEDAKAAHASAEASIKETKEAVEASIVEYIKEAKARKDLSDQLTQAANQQAAANIAADKAANDATIAAFAEIVATAKKTTELEVAQAQLAEAQQEAAIAHALVTHKISKAQEIQQVADAKVKELELEKQYWQSVQSLLPPYSEKWNELQKKITDIEKQEIKIRSKAETDAANAEERNYQKVISGMQTAFSSFTSSLISGHQTIAQSWNNLVDNLAAKFIEGLERQLMQYLVHEAIKQEVDAANHAKSAARDAATAAQHAYTWAADWGGPIAGAISAAAAFAGVMAFGSAEGGQYLVPGPQLTMLHPQEMVLPAALAGRMREVVEEGGTAGGGSQGSGVQIHFHVNAVDGKDAADFITRNSRNIAGAVAKEMKKKGLFSK